MKLVPPSFSWLTKRSKPSSETWTNSKSPLDGFCAVSQCKVFQSKTAQRKEWKIKVGHLASYWLSKESKMQLWNLMGGNQGEMNNMNWIWSLGFFIGGSLVLGSKVTSCVSQFLFLRGLFFIFYWFFVVIDKIPEATKDWWAIKSALAS